jgi:hypothetical protein
MPTDGSVTGGRIRLRENEIVLPQNLVYLFGLPGNRPLDLKFQSSSDDPRSCSMLMQAVGGIEIFSAAMSIG